MSEPIPEKLNKISGRIINAAFKVHKELGPGLLESVYETCLMYEFEQEGLRFAQQKALPVNYKGLFLESGLRLDLLVEDAVVVELKAIDQIQAIHKAQLLTYLKLTGLRLGLLINFNVELIRTGITRVVL
jgi:GxxExxY protein